MWFFALIQKMCGLLRRKRKTKKFSAHDCFSAAIAKREFKRTNQNSRAHVIEKLRRSAANQSGAKSINHTAFKKFTSARRLRVNLTRFAEIFHPRSCFTWLMPCERRLADAYQLNRTVCRASSASDKSETITAQRFVPRVFANKSKQRN